MFILFGTSKIGNSRTLFGILLLAQTLSLILYLFKLYKACNHYILSVMREVQMTFSIAYLFSLHFIDQHTEKLKYRALTIFSTVYLVLICFSLVVSLLDIAFKIVKRVKERVCPKKKKEWRLQFYQHEDGTFSTVRPKTQVNFHPQE